MTAPRAEIREADGPADIEAVRALFSEYGRALAFAHCFDGFDRELAGLPGAYASPAGRLLLAGPADAPLGVVGVQPLAHAGRAEMRRLYVRPAARGRGLGRRLAEAAIAAARAAGHRELVLETLDDMRAAQALYRALGFAERPPYSGAPRAGMRCFRLTLAGAARL